MSVCSTRLALTSGFGLALVEEHDSLLVKLLLRTGVLAAPEALVLVDPLLRHEFAPDRQCHERAVRRQITHAW